MENDRDQRPLSYSHDINASYCMCSHFNRIIIFQTLFGLQKVNNIF